MPRPKLFGLCVGAKSRKKSKAKKPKKPKAECDSKKEEKADAVDAGFGPWDNIVEKSMVGTGIMSSGAVVDKEGKIYGINDDFHLKKKQILIIVQALYEDPNQTTIPKEGIKVGDRTFQYVLCEIGDCMYGKDGDAGIIIRCGKSLILIGVYDNLEKKAIADEMMKALQQDFIKQGV